MLTNSLEPRRQDPAHPGSKVSRLLSIAAVCAIAISLAHHATAETKAVEVHTSRLVLESSDGTVRAELAVTKDGTVELALFQPDGRKRLRMGVLQTGEPGLSLLDDSGKSRLGIALTEKGAPGVLLRDSTGTDRGGVVVDEGDEPRIALCDAEGGRRLACEVSRTGEPSVTLLTSEEKPAGRFSTTEAGRASLLLEAAESRRILLGSRSENDADVEVVDRERRFRLSLGTRTAGGPFGFQMESEHSGAELTIEHAEDSGATLRLGAPTLASSLFAKGGSSSSSGIVLTDGDSKGRIRLSITKGIPSLTFTDPKAREMLIARADEKRGVVETRDGSGRLVWSSSGD